MDDILTPDQLIILCRVIGLAGFVAYLVAFAALQMRIICGNSRIYTCLNLLAATLVLIGLTYEFNLASAMIQISWILISLVGLYVNHSKGFAIANETLGAPIIVKDNTSALK